ncbi:transposase [Nocardia sp. NPDC004604]|uniref:transposase n=1 Tax=Nocardia sp. NPDC004604 TaxID=3157013 RepID=UPI0033ABFCCD
MSSRVGRLRAIQIFLALQGHTGEQIAAELGVSAATLYNWRRQYGGMDTGAAKELEDLREQNARLKRLLARIRAGQGRVAGDRQGIMVSPAAGRRVVDMPTEVMGLSERFACKVVGLHRCTYRWLPTAQSPAGPDAGLRAWLRSYATKHPRHGFSAAPVRRCGSTRARRRTRRSTGSGASVPRVSPACPAINDPLRPPSTLRTTELTTCPAGPTTAVCS